MNALRSRSVALSLTAVLGAATLAGCGNDPDPVANDPAPSADSSSPSEPTEPTDPATEPEPSETTDTGGPATVAAPVYFVGETPLGQRLYREFRKVEADNPYDEALALMVAGDVLDPDYDSVYPDGGFASVEVVEDAILVELADGAWSDVPPGMTKEQAKLAVQQLVHTVQGIAQERLPVRVWQGEPGNAVPLFGIDTAAGLKAADPLDVLALVNVTSPEEGASVSGTFTATGLASSFEATVPWEIRQGDKVVLEGFSTADGWLDKLYPWESEVDVSGLAPGDYTFVAMTDDPSGGAEGPGPFEDSKSITVG